MRVWIEWVINNLLKVLKVLKRDPQLWVFGAWGGDYYSDNSKYLFEYVLKSQNNINAVWITKNRTVKERLTEQGMSCFLYNEFQGIKTRLKAKVVFYTNGINDIGKYDLSHGAIRVALWHGMPLKRMYFAQERFDYKSNFNLRKYLRYVVLKAYNRFGRDITIATSEAAKDLLIKCFEVEPESVYITGQPRNDVLFNDRNEDEVKKLLGHNTDEKFILYIPTWRTLNQVDPFLNNIIINLINDAELNREIKKNKLKLYIKPHPKVIIKEQGNNNIVILNNRFSLDTQMLLRASDILITDYSSAFIDYALLSRPIYFFLPDYGTNQKFVNGLFYSYEEISKSFISNIDELKSLLTNLDDYIELGLENVGLINSIYNAPDLEKGEYCKNVVNVVNRHL